jgi:type I restriction enzyme S subunit
MSPSVDNSFISYSFLLEEHQRWMMNHSSHGATMTSLNQDIIRRIPLRLPPLTIQQRIAGILSAYDELIENSQRRIRILETMARTLYREWFVHFRFPGHEGSRRVSSPLGEIPEGWHVKPLSELLNIDKGVSYNGAGLTDDGNPMVNLKNIQAGGGFRRDATKPYSGDFKPRHTVNPGDVVLANTDLTQAGNVVASPALIPRFDADKPILISHHLYAVRPIQSIPQLFIYHLMLTDDFKGFAKGFAIGTTVLGLPKEGVLNFTFACPPQKLIHEFASKVSAIHELINTLHDSIENLRRTRDLLLPRLLSGQVNLEAHAA